MIIIAAIVAFCISKSIQINRTKHAFNKDLLVTIINMLVFSKLLYCFFVVKYLGQKCTQVAGWLPIEKHLYLRDAILAFKCMTGCAPEYLTKQLVFRGQISGRLT